MLGLSRACFRDIKRQFQRQSKAAGLVFSCTDPISRSSRYPFLPPYQSLSLYRFSTVTCLLNESQKLPFYAGMAKEPSKFSSQRRNKRLLWIGAISCIFGVTLFSFLQGVEEYLMFYMTPTQILLKDPPMSEKKRFRLGGMVVEGSVYHMGPQDIFFTVSDLTHDMRVHFKGILPNLFEEGQGVVAEGYLKPISKDCAYTAEAIAGFDQMVEAVDVLAKHDETYMPEEVVKQMEKNEQLMKRIEELEAAKSKKK